MMTDPFRRVYTSLRLAFAPALTVATGLAGLACAGLLGSSGCGDPPAPAGSAAVSSQPAASASASLPAVSQTDYCKRVCDRATSCGQASALAQKGLEPDAKAAIEKSAGDTTRECVEACTKEPATDARLRLSERCIGEADCTGFSKCLVDLARELKK